MALFAIGDFHLSFQTPEKSMDVFGKAWQHHEEKIKRNCEALVGPHDTLVITGDHSWGRKLPECEQDLAFIAALPGRKILLRGNHDMFWDAKRTASLNRRFEGKLSFLQNNFYAYEDYALVGTKGFTFEGPFYLDGQGRVVGWDEEREAHANKLIERECVRLRRSLDAAVEAGYKKFLLFLHYPPTNILEQQSPFTDIAEEYGVEQVIYSHCHGEERFHDSLQGTVRGITYRLVSGDYLDFRPVKIL